MKVCARAAIGLAALISPTIIAFLAVPVSRAQSPEATTVQQNPGATVPDDKGRLELPPLDLNANGLTPPVMLSRPAPRLIRKGQSQVGGELVLSFVVGIDGAAHDINVVRSVSPDQDKKSVEDLQNSRFEPGRLGDVSVPVRVTVHVNFMPIARWPEFEWPSSGNKSQTVNRGQLLIDFPAIGQQKADTTK
jgi:hypothetical protein